MDPGAELGGSTTCDLVFLLLQILQAKNVRSHLWGRFRIDTRGKGFCCVRNGARRINGPKTIVANDNFAMDTEVALAA